MSISREKDGNSNNSSNLKFFKVVIQFLLVMAILAGLLFIPAGRLNWLDAWIYIIAYGIFLLSYAAWGFLKDPAQLEERSQAQSAKNVKPWDRVILFAYTVCLLALLVVCGLDAGRFRWTFIPPPVRGVGWIGMACAAALIFWCLTTNTYLSRVARIQADRGQVAITSGPYRYVRHPMYLGIIVLFVCSPIVLGSIWAVIPGGMICILFIIRTGKEDRMLIEELSGYSEYTQRVRYRLFPKIW
jgi:protein-S-isoprenylcysteine O-methyltransferase Ste14